MFLNCCQPFKEMASVKAKLTGNVLGLGLLVKVNAEVRALIENLWN